MKRMMIILAAMVAAAGCDKQAAEFREMISMGAKVKTVQCDSLSGTCSFEIYSDKYVNSRDTEPIGFEAQIVGGASWIRFEDGSDRVSKSESSSLNLHYDANTGVKRSASIRLTAGDRTDVVTVKQKGFVDQYLILDGTYAQVPKEGGVYTAVVRSNIVPALLSVKEAKGLDDWNLRNGILTFRIGASESRDIRNIDVVLYTIDGWGDEISSKVTLKQEAGK